MVFESSKCTIDRDGKLVAEGLLDDSHYYLCTYAAQNGSSQLHACVVNVDCWHEGLAHVNVEAVKQMVQKKAVLGVKVDLAKPPKSCGFCWLGKSTRASVPQSSSNRARRPLELVQSDVCLMLEKSLEKSKYFVTFSVDFFRYCWVYAVERSPKLLGSSKSGSL